MMDGYKAVMRVLLDLDENQLIELFYDIAEEDKGLLAINRLSDVSNKFLNAYTPNISENSEREEFEEVDGALRAREAREINGGKY